MLRKMSQALKYYDIGLNLSDPMYQGIYHGKKYHECDIKHLLHRAKMARVQNMLLTGSSILESKQVVQLSHQYHTDETRLYYTLGVHPCCVNEFVLDGNQSTIDNPTNDIEFNEGLDITDINFTKSKIRELFELINERSQDPQFRAIGEIGLDYDRFYYSSKKMQLLLFEEQLKLSCLFPEKPLFLHMRNCCSDFVAVLKKFLIGFTDSADRFDLKELIDIPRRVPYLPWINESGEVCYKFSPNRRFVTHSFTGSVTEMQEILSLSDYSYIGMNGCSFKTEENINCVKSIPLNKLLLETDAPWCDIRRTHDSYKYLFSDLSSCKLETDDPWNFGLSQAYPDIQKWFKSVKRDRLDKNPIQDRDNITIKSRNEPCFLGHVASVVARVKDLPIEDVASQVWEVTCDVYGE
ncbi:LANO_0F10968g1_1 [Lachancea nothofagi CBS 11611]|uniref:LANO_0F10968g1_1 n=1 Tax=Lachancea nothofagi CBS 11611 TaxID=1266666 RepID=A0A1G4KAS8_9SACH|nr:LANO_0F10968g1_1 [Lachancea nothofagi CBS 11611]